MALPFSLGCSKTKLPPGLPDLRQYHFRYPILRLLRYGHLAPHDEPVEVRLGVEDGTPREQRFEPATYGLEVRFS